MEVSQSHSETRAQGHAPGALRAAAAHPTLQEVATLGDGDGLRVWAAGDRAVLGRVALPSPGRSVAYWPGRAGLLVGLASGAVVYAEGAAPGAGAPGAPRDAAAPVLSALSVDPSGRRLAVGFEHGVLDLLDISGGPEAGPLPILCTGKGPAGAIDRIDWSEDGKVLQV